MPIQFFQNENDIPQNDAFIAYNKLKDRYLYYCRQQSKCEFFYWKGMGIFLLAIIASFILAEKEFIPSAFFGVLIAGMGCLLIFTQNIRMDFNYSSKATACVETGLSLEKNIRLFCQFIQNFR